MIIPNIWKNKIHVPNHQPDLFCNFGSTSFVWLGVFSQGPNPADLGQWPTWWSPGFEKQKTMWSRPVINCVITSKHLNLSIVNPSQLISLCSFNLGNPFRTSLTSVQNYLSLHCTFGTSSSWMVFFSRMYKR